ncbi:S-adenosyl-L-methionine-dependent methyltransferase [Hypoxylon sp. FL0890]|nr:S-adenosyl-L-methionine-dependent methyltransferase [Hypoxylon sp. FL0890]
MFSNFRRRLETYLEPLDVLEWAYAALILVGWNAVRSRGLRAFSEVSRWPGQAFAVWYLLSNDHFVPLDRTTVIPDLVASAEGTILEPGPGLGNQIPRFNKAKVKHIYGVEINEVFAHGMEFNGTFYRTLQTVVDRCGLGEKYTIIHSGVERSDVLEEHGIMPGSIDTIVSIQVLCSVAQPETVMKNFYRLLKPGGKLIFWEHTRSYDWATRIVQNLWTIPWKFFLGGCRLNRDIIQIIMSAGVWEGADSIQRLEEEPWDIMPTVWGTLVKP